MINKQAEINKRMRTYLACRGILRIKSAEDVDVNRAMELANEELNAGGSTGTPIKNRFNMENYGANAGRYLRSGWDAARAKSKELASTGYDRAGRWINNAYNTAGNAINGMYNGAKNTIYNTTAGLYDYGKDFVTGFKDNPGSSMLGLASGAGFGYVGSKAGDLIADKLLGLKEDSKWRKALKWGLGGLSGLAGFYLGRGFGKGWSGQGNNNTPPADGTTPPNTPPNVPPNAPPAGSTAPATSAADSKKAMEKARFVNFMKNRTAASKTGSYNTLNYVKPVQVRNIPGGIERRHIGTIEPRSDAYGKSKKK